MHQGRSRCPPCAADPTSNPMGSVFHIAPPAHNLALPIAPHGVWGAINTL